MIRAFVHNRVPQTWTFNGATVRKTLESTRSMNKMPRCKTGVIKSLCCCKRFVRIKCMWGAPQVFGRARGLGGGNYSHRVGAYAGSGA